MKVETVKVKNDDMPNGYIVINKSDLKKSDKLYAETKKTKAK